MGRMIHMKHNVWRMLVVAALLLATVSLAGCSMAPVNVVVEFDPNPIDVYPNEPLDVFVTLTLNGVGVFRLSSVRLTLKDSSGDPIMIPVGLDFENPYIVPMEEPYLVLGMAGIPVPMGWLHEHLDEEARTLPPDAWLLAPLPSSLTIEFFDTRNNLRGGGTLDLAWHTI
jgi:hypothetical protein